MFGKRRGTSNLVVLCKQTYKVTKYSENCYSSKGQFGSSCVNISHISGAILFVFSLPCSKMMALTGHSFAEKEQRSIIKKELLAL